jgi:HSP20 family protein
MRKFFNKITGINKKEYADEETEDEPVEEELGEQAENEDNEEYDTEEELEESDEAEDEIEEADDEKDEETNWLGGEYEEGQLSIDVYQTPESLVVKSTIAGVKPDDIDISINNDLLTIRGKREMVEKIKDENYLFRECYWGSFSRSIILPVEVIPEKIDASLENGVLTVILPKAKASKQISIKVKSK